MIFATIFALLLVRTTFAETPVLSITPPRLSSPDGLTRVFVCTFYGIDANNIDKVQWMKRTNGVDVAMQASTDRRIQMRYLTPEKSELELLIDPVEVEDSAIYVCQATYRNEFEEEKTMVQTADVKIAKKIALSDCESEQHPTSGEEAEIKCTLEEYHPDLITWWTRESNSVSQIKQGGPRSYEFSGEHKVGLLIPMYEPDVDDGIYVFNAVLRGFVGSPVEQVITVTGYVPPRIVRKEGDETVEGLESSDLEIVCQATGKPVPTFTWFKADSLEALSTTDKYTVTDGQLIIHAYIDDDVDSYKCVAQNTVDKDSYDVITSIFHKPRVDPIANQTTSEGSAVQFVCKYSADGQLDAFWTYMGNKLGFEHVVDNVEEGGSGTKMVTKSGDSLTLHISEVQSLDMDEYTCTVENRAGAVSRTAKLSVTRAPAITSLSGETISWSGNKVDIFCVADGVPAPQWSWYSPLGDVIVGDNQHMIVNLDMGQKSVLTVTTRDGEFGEFKCVAENSVDKTEAPILVKEIRVPPMVSEIDPLDAHPTSIHLELNSLERLLPMELPGELVFVYASQAQFDMPDFDWDLEQTTATNNIPFNENSNEYVIGDLRPETEYHMRIKAGNAAGFSDLSPDVVYRTSSARPPVQPIFDESNLECDAMSCEISWVEPDSMGADITQYKLSFARVQKPNRGMGEQKIIGEYHTEYIDSMELNYLLNDLQPASDYLIKLAATNSIGDGEPGSLFIKTQPIPESGMTAGGIVGIVVVVLIIVLIIVDITCYLVNQCGVLMCLCVNCCGKTPPEVKAKEIAMEEGVKSDKTPLQEPEKEEKGEAQEDTPMIDNEDKVHTQV